MLVPTGTKRSLEVAPQLVGHRNYKNWSKVAQERAELVGYHCEVCFRRVPLNDGQAHHVLPKMLARRAKGLPHLHILANAEWSCADCENRRHKKSFGNFFLKDRAPEMRKVHTYQLAPQREELLKLQLGVHDVLQVRFEELRYYHHSQSKIQWPLPPIRFHTEVLGCRRFLEICEQWAAEQTSESQDVPSASFFCFFYL